MIETDGQAPVGIINDDERRADGQEGESASNDRVIDVTLTDGTTTPLRRYTHHGSKVDKPLQLETFDAAGAFEARYSYHADHLGSIRFLTDALGEVVNAYDYDSYGQKVVAMEGVEQPFRFTGREWDEAAKLYHYRARAYDATIGRFLQEDPAGVIFENLKSVLDELKKDFSHGELGTSILYSRLGSFPTHNINPYRYVESNPLNYVDQFGRSPISINSIDGYKRGMIVANSMRYVAESVANRIVGTLFIASTGATKGGKIMKYLRDCLSSASHTNTGPNSLAEMFCALAAAALTG